MKRAYRLLPALALFALSAASQAQAQSAQRGEALFKQRCGACHSVTGGRSVMGPDLAGVVGRRAGQAPGFNYSKAMQQSGLVWTGATLDPFLASPGTAVKGTRMMSMVPNAADRADIIAFLATKR